MHVEGSLRTRKYMDKDGVEKYATDIRADSMQMLGGRAQADFASNTTSASDDRSIQARNTANARASVDNDLNDDLSDIPF